MTEEVPQAQVPQASPEPEYNRLFSIFTDRSASSSQLSGLVAYALYKQAKVEWATEQRNKYGRAPTPEELNGYHSSWTTTMVNSVRQQADGALAAFTEDAVSEAEPQVLREALKGKRRRDLVIGITSGILAALIWTLLLILFALVLKWADIDVISYLHKLEPPTRTP